MARNTFYNRTTSTVVIDGVTVKGIAEGNAIRVVEEADGATTVEGLDRAMTNINNDGRARLEIDLLPTSPYIAVANGIKRRQNEGSGRLMDGSVRSGVNELEKLQAVTYRPAAKLVKTEPLYSRLKRRWVTSRESNKITKDRRARV